MNGILTNLPETVNPCRRHYTSACQETPTARRSSPHGARMASDTVQAAMLEAVDESAPSPGGVFVIGQYCYARTGVSSSCRAVQPSGSVIDGKAKSRDAPAARTRARMTIARGAAQAGLEAPSTGPIHGLQRPGFRAEGGGDYRAVDESSRSRRGVLRGREDRDSGPEEPVAAAVSRACGTPRFRVPALWDAVFVCGEDLVTPQIYSPPLRQFNVYSMDTPTISDQRRLGCSW